MAPTILYLLGLPIPEEIDGRVLQEAIKEAYLRKNTPIYKKFETEIETLQEKNYSKDESKKIGDKLKGMGYID